MAVTPAPLPSGNATLCISVAARPGRFGVTVHNAAYRALGLDYLYKAVGVRDDIAGVMAAVRLLGIRGCGVSMPFKTAVMAHLDAVDPVAAAIGAVNTVVNDTGRLTGHNTDADGVAAALDALSAQPRRVLLVGAGGVARTVAWTLRQRGVAEILIAARRSEQAEDLAADFAGEGVRVAAVDWNGRGREAADLLINATPIGMSPEEDALPVPAAAVGNFGGVIDLVATPPVTRLVRTAAAAGLPAVDGLTIALHQAAAQFRLYTGHPAPLEVMRAAADGLR